MVRCHLKGRLGNTLFEIASCYAYALDHNMPFTLSNTTKDPVMQPLYFQNLVNLDWNPNKPAKFITEMQHNYEPLPWEDDWKNYNIEMKGFWQSEKYFKHRRSEILKLFNIPYNKIEMVSIHVRRGDYLTIPGKHILMDDDYMKTAVDFFRQKGYNNFLVFSDDISFCENYFKNHEGLFDFVKDNDPLDDLMLMSNCVHQINSSSTFSWWGAWLNQNPDKIVITPKEWFQSTQPENTNDIIPESWIKI